MAKEEVVEMFEFSKVSEDPEEFTEWEDWFKSRGVKCEVRCEIDTKSNGEKRKLYSLYREGKEKRTW